MDIKILDLATKLTEKAMGTESSAVSWIGKEDQVAKFLEIIAEKLHTL